MKLKDLQCTFSLLGASRLSTTLLGAAVIGGCTMGPNYQKPAALEPAQFSQWHGGSKELLQGRESSTAPIPRWQDLHDPTLDQLLARAIESNADTLTAGLRLAQSRALSQSAASAWQPQLAATASTNRIRLSQNSDSTRMIDMLMPPAQQQQALASLAQPYNSESIGLDFSWELDLWGRVKRSLEAANAQLAASESLLQQVRWSVQAEVAQHYFELRGIDRQIELTDTDIAAAQDSLQLIEARAKGGLVTYLDVTRQQALVADLRSRRPPLLAQQAQASNALTLLLALPPGALEEIVHSRQSPNQTLEASPLLKRGPGAWPDLTLGLPSDVARRRPDITRAEAQLHAATANIGVAEADFYPRLTLGAHFGFQALNADDLGNWGNRLWSLGPSLSMPLFDNGRRRATLIVRNAEQQQAAIALHQTTLQAWHEIDNALNAYSSERMRYAKLVEKEANSLEALSLAKASYSNGMTDFLVQLDAQRTVLASQRERINSETQLGLTWCAVIKALGPEPEQVQAKDPGQSTPK